MLGVVRDACHQDFLVTSGPLLEALCEGRHFAWAKAGRMALQELLNEFWKVTQLDTLSSDRFTFGYAWR